MMRAKKVLEQFDIVLLTETMGNREWSELLSDAFSVPLTVDSAETKKKNENIRHGRLVLDGMKQMIPETFKLLKERSHYEMALYQYAVKLNKRLLNQWRQERGTTEMQIEDVGAE